MLKKEIVQRFGLEKIFNGIFEGTANGIILFDRDTKIKAVNSFYLQVIEEERNKTIGRIFEDFWPEEVKEKNSGYSA